MKKEILFIHSAGPQGFHEGSDFLVSYLRNTLGADYQVLSPMMPNPENPHFNSWKVKLENAIASIEGDNVFLIGHSIGGSVILKFLSESTPKKNIAGLFLVAAPYWGSVHWNVDEFKLRKNFLVTLPHIDKVFLYHSSDDEVVPLEHMVYYAEKLPHAKVRALKSNGHLFSKGLPELVMDIRNLKGEIEVFKTDVNDAMWAKMLKGQIAQMFAEYEVHFDLEDCDKVMRIKSTTGSIQRMTLINLLKDFGFQAEVMKD